MKTTKHTNQPNGKQTSKQANSWKLKPATIREAGVEAAETVLKSPAAGVKGDASKEAKKSQTSKGSYESGTTKSYPKRMTDHTADKTRAC